MTKTDMIKHLIKARLFKIAEKQMLSNDECIDFAEQKLEELGINSFNALNTPEGSILSIIETYLKNVAGRCIELGGPDYFKQANDDVIKGIEKHRSLLVKGESNYPLDIDEYVFYRIRLELKYAKNCEPEDIGLDKPIVIAIAHTAKSLVMNKSKENSVGAGSSSCFIATACFDSSSQETVLLLRVFREKILKKSSAGRFLIYWYYIFSPSLAEKIKNQPSVKSVMRFFLYWTARFLKITFSLGK